MRKHVSLFFFEPSRARLDMHIHTQAGPVLKIEAGTEMRKYMEERVDVTARSRTHTTQTPTALRREGTVPALNLARRESARNNAPR